MYDFLTDGQRLYEIASRRTVRNYGLAGGDISYTIIRDCVSELEACVDDLTLLTLEPVRQAA